LPSNRLLWTKWMEINIWSTEYERINFFFDSSFVVLEQITLIEWRQILIFHEIIQWISEYKFINYYILFFICYLPNSFTKTNSIYSSCYSFYFFIHSISHFLNYSLFFKIIPIYFSKFFLFYYFIIHFFSFNDSSKYYVRIIFFEKIRLIIAYEYSYFFNLLSFCIILEMGWIMLFVLTLTMNLLFETQF
jgi:hypothetical protein